MRVHARSYNEDANLQADVMRFMAIVAFCLIAILAMVRQTPSNMPMVEPAPAQPEIHPEPPPPAELPQPPASRVPPPAQLPPAEAQPVEQAVPNSAETPAETTAPPPVEVLPLTPPTADERVDAVDTSITQEPGLTLQFASERDFMRLIAKGRVTVYAYREDEFLALDRSHTFHATEPPAQVYELDTATIPALIHLALPAGTPQSELTWGVVLPPKVERQIRQHVDQELRGELHINRYEEVRHVAAR